MQPRRPISRVRRILFAALATVLFLALAEAAMAVLGVEEGGDFAFKVRRLDNDTKLDFVALDRDLLWRLKRGYRSALVEVSGLGLRDPREDFQKPPGVSRILCLGDSSTFGFYVEAGESYPQVLETLLNQGAGRTEFEVVNAGVPGYGNLQMMRYFTLEGRKFRPDVVVMPVSPNNCNARYNAGDHAVMDGSRGGSFLSRVSGWMERSRLYASLRRAIRTARHAGGKPDRTASRLTFGEFEKDVREFREVCRESGAKLVLLLLPYDSGKMAQKESGPCFRDFLRRARGLRLGDMAVLSLEFPEAAPPGNAGPLLIDEVHPTPAGHRWIAEKLFRHLSENGLTDRP